MSENPTPPKKTFAQSSPYASPWNVRTRLGLLAWNVAWTLLCAWTPKPFNFWRLFVLRCFGARLQGTPFVHSRARIHIPWHLSLAHRACLGDRAAAYSLGPIAIGEGATIAQEAYLCTGTHDFADAALPLQTAPIVVGAGAFVGARAFVLPGVTIGERAVIGAAAVVTKDVPANTVVAGNPARPIGTRPVA
jgi:putative colanic acid biosynthesis acetyltransferase WcaF